MRTLALFVSTAALIAVAAFTFRIAAAFPLQAPPTGDPQTKGVPAHGRDLGQWLMAGLNATPGCLGVEAANTASGKNVIFAWFENKRAVLAWLDSDVHKAARGRFGFPPPPADYVALDGVADDAGPLMCVASVTFPKAAPAANADAPAGGEPQPPAGAPDRPAPLFSIEIYTPVTPGLHTAPAASFSPADVGELFKTRRKAAATPPINGR